jgi:probable F420-dependent oxidoreductase
MKLGFSTMNSDTGIAPHRLAVAVEERGFDSLWFGEHPHIPVQTKSPRGPGLELPGAYLRMMDPFVSLTAAAMVTSTLRLGTSVALIMERDPFVLAKETATLDLLSGGRLILGVGAGWNQPEYENHTSVPWSKRYQLLRDHVGALRALWTQHDASYRGEFIAFDPVWSYPKPLQKPHPPILLGATGPLGLAHTVEWADGWFPLVSSFEQFQEAHSALLVRAKQAGRDPATIEITASIGGHPDAADLVRYRDLGVARVRLTQDPAVSLDEHSLLSRLDGLADLIPLVSE